MTAVATKLPRPPLMDERVLPIVDDEWRTALEIYALFGEEGRARQGARWRGWRAPARSNGAMIL